MTKDPVEIPVEGGKIVVYHSRDNGWRWHTIAHNGKIVADSGESYTLRFSAVRAAKKFASSPRT